MNSHGFDTDQHKILEPANLDGELRAWLRALTVHALEPISFLYITRTSLRLGMGRTAFNAVDDHHAHATSTA